MIKNYFKIAARNILKQKGYSLINIIGLAIGITCFFFILMFVNDELNFDGYNEKATRIYRVAQAVRFSGRDFNVPKAPPPLTQTLINECPEVEDAMRIRMIGTAVFKYEDKVFKERNLVYIDPSLFNIFSIHLLEGDPNTALKNPSNLIISKKAAEKYFGKKSAMGKILKINDSADFTVSGVFEGIPRQSHFHFDVILSMESFNFSKSQTWLSNSFYHYVLLRENSDPRTLEAKFPQIIKKYMAPQLEKAMGKSMDELIKSGTVNIKVYLQPLRDIHLHSDLMEELEPNSDIKYVYIFSAIAFFLLILAAINFMNLSTARAANRSKEVGLRKVMGSFRSHLIWQFLCESIISSIIAMFLALLLITLLLPQFSSISGKEFMESDYLNGGMMGILLVISLFTGLLAGLYPAFFISAYQPADVIKGQLHSGTKSGKLRSFLVVFQFTVSIILIICTMVVINQLQYLENKKLGFTKENVLVLEDAYLLGNQIDTFKDEMLKYPQVKNASISGFAPGPCQKNSCGVYPVGKPDTIVSMENWLVDYDFIDTISMKIIQGRNFSREFSTDESTIILNQAAVQQFGLNDPIGNEVTRTVSAKGDTKTHKIIGVVENFHFQSLRDTIAPMVIVLGMRNPQIYFRINTSDIPGFIGILRDKWVKFLSNRPFEYFFLDQRIDEYYSTEQKMGKIFGVFSLLAIVIGCLGLFGLTAFIAGQRTKEIGIRKVLGASVSDIVSLLTRHFVILVCIANIIAWPIAYFIMSKWLEDFAYRTPFRIWTFLAAGMITILIALFTVSYQAVKAALYDPVKSIKYE